MMVSQQPMMIETGQCIKLTPQNVPSPGNIHPQNQTKNQKKKKKNHITSKCDLTADMYSKYNLPNTTFLNSSTHIP
jgi:hypothetical protein